MTDLVLKMQQLLPLLGFTEQGHRWTRIFEDHERYALTVDLNRQTIDWGSQIEVGDSTTSNLAQAENLVVLECVCRLLQKGYKPASLVLEQRWQLGRTRKGGKCDIGVRDHNGDILVLIECKTWGAEYDKEFRRMRSNGGQLFSYLTQDTHVRFLCLYASTVESGAIRYENAIVGVTDDPVLVASADAGDTSILLYRDANTTAERHRVWKESLACYAHPNGLFDPDAVPYAIELKPLKLKNLRPLAAGDGSFVHNQFAEILRHNNISDRENAFNRMISLFLCKLVDEERGEEDVLHFQWREGVDTHEDLQDRLQKLYRQGMDQYLQEEVVYFGADDVESAFAHQRFSVAKEAMHEMLRQLKFYSNNEFAFRRVHNRRLFQQNAKVLAEVVKLLQPYRIGYARRDQFLGNLFELLLNDGVKQSEGQFFTPMPITEFIVDSLPLDQWVRNHHRIPKVLDYACGSGHFLTMAVSRLQPIAERHGLTTASDTRWTRDRVFGIERDYRLARVSKIASFMNGAGDTTIVYGDGLERHDRVPEPVDVVIANPPYSIKDFKQHLRLERNDNLTLLESLTDTSGEIEVLFLERTAQVLATGGLAAVILPTSLLSNPGSVGVAARRLLLEQFHLRAIVELPGTSFIATGTTTVVLFLERRSDHDAQHARFRAEAVFDAGELDPNQGDLEGLESLCAHLGLNLEDYLSVRTGAPSDGLMATEFWRDHLASFKGREPSLPVIREREKRRFATWTLLGQTPLLIARSGAGKELEREFLGYTWSKRRGAEGLKPLGPGLLPVIAPLVRSMMTSSEPQIPESLGATVRRLEARDLLEWDLVDLDLRLNTAPEVSLRQASRYPSVRFHTLASLEYGKSLPQRDRRSGPCAVAGSNGIDGWHDTPLCSGPAVVVGRKGSAGQVNWIAEDCWPIDTTFYLSTDQMDLRFAYWLLRWLELPRLVGRKGVGVPGLNRNDVYRARIPQVPATDQQAILLEIDSIETGRQDTDRRRLAVVERWMAG